MSDFLNRSALLNSIAAAANIVYPSAKKNPHYETPDQIGGNYEAPTTIYNEFGPIPIPGLHRMPFWEDEYFSYFKRRPDSNRLIDQCRAQGDCNPRVAAWNNLVDRLKVPGVDDKTKVQMVNAWVNEMIEFDDDKNEKVPSHNLVDRHQTSFTTLTSGRGMCDDIALLKYETLRAVGIRDENMRLISGFAYDPDNPKEYGGHMELMANVDGRNYLLNNNLTADGWKLKHGGIEPASVQIQGEAGGAQYRYGRFVPIASENEAGGILYYGVTQDGPDNYRLSSIRYNPADPANYAQICAANSCIDINQRNIDPKIQQQIRDLIKQAHDLNPGRLPPDLQTPIPVPSQTPLINRMPDRLPPSSQPDQAPAPRQNGNFPYRSTESMSPPTTPSVMAPTAPTQIRPSVYATAHP